MSQAPSTYQVYRHINKNRSKKKRYLYKLAFGVALDKTTLTYLAFFAVLGLMGAHDTLKQMHPFFIFAEQVVRENYSSLLILAVLRPLSLSFTRPGVRFSSAEMLLSLLPYERKKLWLYNAYDRNKRYALFLIAIGLFVFLITPFSGWFIMMVVASLVVTEMLMTIPQWVIYQLPWYIKILIIQSMGLLGMVTFFFLAFVEYQAYLSVGMLLLLFLLNKTLTKYIFHRVNWQEVVKTNDRLIWNIFFIAKMSQIETKPPKRKGMYHHFVRNQRLKRPFSQDKPQAIYNRLYFLLFAEHKEQVIKGYAGMLVILVVLSWQNIMLLGISIALTTSLYGQLSVSFFQQVFVDNLIYSLPWQIESWKNNFLRWIYFGSLPLIITTTALLFFFTDQWIWIPFLIISYVIIGKHFITFNMLARIRLMTKRRERISIIHSIWIVVLFFCAINSIASPFISILVILAEGIRYTWNRSYLAN